MSKWTEIELENRSTEIVEILLRLYPLPATTFRPLPKPVEEVSLEEETFSPTSRVLKGFRIFGSEYAETTWKGMLLKVVSVISENTQTLLIPCTTLKVISGHLKSGHSILHYDWAR